MSFIFGGNTPYENAAEAGFARERALANIERAQGTDYEHAAPALVGLLSSIVNRKRLQGADRAASAFADSALKGLGVGDVRPGLDLGSLGAGQKGALIDNLIGWHYGQGRLNRQTHGQALARMDRQADLNANAAVAAANAKLKAMADAGIDVSDLDRKAMYGVDATPAEEAERERQRYFAMTGEDMTPEDARKAALSALGVETRPVPPTPGDIAVAESAAKRGLVWNPEKRTYESIDDRIAATGGAGAEAVARDREKAAQAQAAEDRKAMAKKVQVQTQVENVLNHLSWTTQGVGDVVFDEPGEQKRYDNALINLRAALMPIALKIAKDAGAPATTDEKRKAMLDSIFPVQVGDDPADVREAIINLERQGIYDPSARQKWNSQTGGAAASIQGQFGAGNNLDASLIELEG